MQCVHSLDVWFGTHQQRTYVQYDTAFLTRYTLARRDVRQWMFGCDEMTMFKAFVRLNLVDKTGNGGGQQGTNTRSPAGPLLDIRH